MARKMFSLSELRNLDFGKMDAAFQRELAKIIDDIGTEVPIIHAQP